MKAVIVEDEVLAANRLEKLLNDVAPEIEVAARLSSVKEAVKWFTLNSANLIFLDIQLSDGLSFSIFDEVTVNTPVIFTTAYDKYSIKAFQLNSIDYLLKPIRKAELQKSLQKYNSLKSAFKIDFENLLAGIQGKTENYKKRFLIQVGSRIKTVEIKDVAWFQADGKYVFLKTFAGKTHPVDFSLDKLENMVDPAQFFRINRKYMVSIEAIEGMTAWSRSRVKIKLNPPAGDETETVVSIDRSPDFKKWLDK